MADPRSMHSSDDFVRLWIHECKRVFEDRLVNEAVRSSHSPPPRVLPHAAITCVCVGFPL